MKHTPLSLILGLALNSTLALAAPDDSGDKTRPDAPSTKPASNDAEAYKLYLTPVPVIGYNPANGTIYGVGASSSIYFGEPETTRVSNLLIGVAHTTLGQTIALFKSTAYASDNQWAFLGDWRYLDSSQPTYGLGTGPDSGKLVAGQDVPVDDAISADTISIAQQLEYKYVRLI